MERSSSNDTIRGAKIVGASILCGFSLLGVVYFVLGGRDEEAIGLALIGLVFLHQLVSCWFDIQPLRAMLDLLSGDHPGTTDNREGDEDGSSESVKERL